MLEEIEHSGRPAARLQRWEPGRWAVADDWRGLVDGFLASAAGRQLAHFVQRRIAAGVVVYPPQPLRALELTALAAVRVVILGQDPYHGPGQAEGLAFSVAPEARLPPSLRNIFEEQKRDLGAPPPMDGSLARWARQGVLLLNTCLTVEDGKPASHANHGWEVLTDQIVEAVAERPGPVAFLLWGAHAQAGRARIAAGAARRIGVPPLVLCANHPSPLAARRGPKPFIGCGHFGRANAYLVDHGRPAITW
ncbi:MAG: Uracil-DNA glycosylase, family 1 [Burkholderiaceae bacterium]|nr:MAG: Uracil-DNA glycosylase, family 1 [Burkholderiaceae bacterium]